MAFPKTAQSVKQFQAITETRCRIRSNVTNNNQHDDINSTTTENYSKVNYQNELFGGSTDNADNALTHDQILNRGQADDVVEIQKKLIKLCQQQSVITNQNGDKQQQRRKAIFTVQTLPSSNDAQKLLIKKVQMSTTTTSGNKMTNKKATSNKVNEEEGNEKMMMKKKAKTKIKKEREIKIHRYSCKFCHQTFVDRITSQLHRDLAHPIRDKFYCAICNNNWAYKGKQRLLEHMQYKHCAEEKCPHCDKIFRKVRLDIHLKVVHSEERSCICQYCKVGFGTKLQLRRHIRRAHVDPEDWKCECNICGKKFAEHARLNSHKAIHNPQQIICGKCGKVFTMMQYLKQHLKTHETDSYKCPLCPMKAFSFITTLRLHMNAHHPELPIPPPGTVLKNYNWNQILKSAQYQPKISIE